MTNTWPEAQMQKLLHCYNVRHMSSGECAMHFDVTRNTIIGKIKRGRAKYGFERRGSNVEAKQRARFKQKKHAPNGEMPGKSKQKKSWKSMQGKLPDANNKAIATVGPNGLRDSVVNAKFVEPAPEEATAHNCSIWQLEPRNCVWPVSGQGANTVYCGYDKTTQSYCAWHSQRAYRNFA